MGKQRGEESTAQTMLIIKRASDIGPCTSIRLALLPPHKQKRQLMRPFHVRDVSDRDRSRAGDRSAARNSLSYSYSYCNGSMPDYVLSMMGFSSTEKY